MPPIPGGIPPIPPPSPPSAGFSAIIHSVVKSNPEIESISSVYSAANWHERETYEQTIRKMLFILNTIRKSPESANKILRKIDKNTKRKNEYTKVNQEQIKKNSKPNSNIKQKLISKNE